MKQMFSHDGGKTWPSHHVISDKVGFNYTSIRPSHRVQFKAAVAQAKDSKIAVMTFHCVHAASQREGCMVIAMRDLAKYVAMKK